jgi:hypothetical protein
MFTQRQKKLEIKLVRVELKIRKRYSLSTAKLLLCEYKLIETFHSNFHAAYKYYT